MCKAYVGQSGHAVPEDFNVASLVRYFEVLPSHFCSRSFSPGTSFCSISFDTFPGGCRVASRLPL